MISFVPPQSTYRINQLHDFKVSTEQTQDSGPIIEASQEVPTDMPALQTRGVHGCLGGRTDQAALLGMREHSLEHAFESVFFERRAWAFWRVVK